jgi:hypothetical protein
MAVSRRLVAVFAADVEGYSRLMGAHEVGTLKDARSLYRGGLARMNTTRRSQLFWRQMSLLPEGASGVVNIQSAETLLLLPRRRRQLSAFDFEIAPNSAPRKGPGEP